MAKSRLWSLKRRFNRNPEAHSLYRAKIDEMINLGHAKEVKDTTPLKEEERFWYIPHHYVANPKFRMVFDCAASVGGVSLIIKFYKDLTTLIHCWAFCFAFAFIR